MDDTCRDLAVYRLEQAAVCLSSAQLLLQAGDYKSAANRSYYTIFHCMRSLLALDRQDFKKHSGVISYFRQHYIKTGIFNKEYSRIITGAFDIRNTSDYDDFVLISKTEVEQQIANAQLFLNAVKNYLTEQKII